MTEAAAVSVQLKQLVVLCIQMFAFPSKMQCSQWQFGHFFFFSFKLALTFKKLVQHFVFDQILYIICTLLTLLTLLLLIIILLFSRFLFCTFLQFSFLSHFYYFTLFINLFKRGQSTIMNPFSFCIHLKMPDFSHFFHLQSLGREVKYTKRKTIERIIQ